MKVMKIIFLLFGLCIAGYLNAQEVKVMTLGTFHFDFPNLDVVKIEEGDQIDVLSPEYQEEINDITARIARFRPSIIAIEVSPKNQSKIDSLYREYRSGNHILGRNEYEQIGFRLAGQLGLDKLYCTNDWGELPEKINNVVYGNDSIGKQDFMQYFYHNPDSALFYDRQHVYKSKGIRKDLIQSNSDEHLKKDLGNYLISVFKYESKDNPFFGVDFTTGWWFNRNLRIFRNIQRIPTRAGDRILVIYGTGHMNILNILFDASPEYELVHINNYLK